MAMCDCEILRVSRQHFIHIMQVNDDFRHQVVEIATEREKIRIKLKPEFDQSECEQAQMQLADFTNFKEQLYMVEEGAKLIKADDQDILLKEREDKIKQFVEYRSAAR